MGVPPPSSPFPMSISLFFLLAIQGLEGLPTDESLRCNTLIDLRPATGIDLKWLRYQDTEHSAHLND